MKFVLASVVIEFAIGFMLALALNAIERFKTVYYLILLAPLLVNPVVVGLLWRMLLHTELGIVNYVVGPRTCPEWFQSSDCRGRR